MEMITLNGVVSVADLSEKFNVTYQTIRRDLRALQDRGLLQKGFGGAFAAPGVSFQRYAERLQSNVESKRRLVLALEPFLAENDTVFVGLGTTFAAMHEVAARVAGMLIATPNLEVAYSCSQRTDTTVFVYGGYIKNKDSAILTSHDASRTKFQFDTAIIGASAVNEDGVLLEFDPLEVDLVKSILPLSKRVIAVLHEEKFGKRAPHRVTDLGSLDVLITNCNAAGHLRSSDLLNGVQIVRV
jgi:DeoR family glycerol-3-phosphate regulon repressor